MSDGATTVIEIILQLPGFISEDPTMPLFYSVETNNHTESEGSYTFLTHVDNEAPAKQFIDEKLNVWLQQTTKYEAQKEKFRYQPSRQQRNNTCRFLTINGKTLVMELMSQTRLRNYSTTLFSLLGLGRRVDKPKGRMSSLGFGI